MPLTRSASPSASASSSASGSSSASASAVGSATASYVGWAGDDFEGSEELQPPASASSAPATRSRTGTPTDIGAGLRAQTAPPASPTRAAAEELPTPTATPLPPAQPTVGGNAESGTVGPSAPAAAASSSAGGAVGVLRLALLLTTTLLAGALTAVLAA